MQAAGQFSEKQIRRRYIVAVVAVVMLCVAGLIVERTAFSGAYGHGPMIRLAAEQRSLMAQSIAFADAARAQTFYAAYVEHIEALQQTRNQLLRNHEALIADRGAGMSGNWSDELEVAYFQAPLTIDRRLRNHIEQVDRQLIRDSFDSSAEASIDAEEAAALLQALDEILGIYEEALAAQLDKLSIISYSIIVAILLSLLLVGWLVFQPVMAQLRLDYRQLADANQALLKEVSERHKLTVKHAAAEAKFRNAFENAPIGMGLMDAEGFVFDANPALRSFFPNENGGIFFDLRDILDDEDIAAFEEQIAAFHENPEPVSQQLQCQTADDSDMIAAISLSPVLGGEGGIEYIVVQVQDVTESQTLNTRLEYQASYDELTGLMNRRAFNREIEKAWEDSDKGQRNSFLLFMDLDQFKVINDTSGHAAGDQLLKRVSELITDCVRSDDVVCRLGGDEFGIVLKQCPADVAKRIAETIRSNIDSLRFVWGSETYRVGVSVGAVPLDPALGDVNEIQQLADAACYAAKEAGRNCVQMVSEGKSDARRHRRQIRWVQRLRDAMDNNRFAIYGQAIQPTTPRPDAPEMVEVLLRLRDPDQKRLIPPGAFLPAAERYGLNVELDEWVITRLLDMLFVHHAFQASDVRYWVNLSGNSIGDERFAKTLKEAVLKAPLPPGTINFEVTETAVIRNVNAAGRLMGELREMGCQMALDDFGSGLSSFGHLKHLPIDMLKIDGMFIKDLDQDSTNRIFVKSIIDIAHSRGIATVAEYVENEAVRKTVEDLGVDYVQGFGIAKPYVLAPKFPERRDEANIIQLAG
ncbi:MAG: EAL domain-containing protein [Woeseiaceae bacterium]|nr:EAL domain-containing protein [Woeseiaceae bacterium]